MRRRLLFQVLLPLACHESTAATAQEAAARLDVALEQHFRAGRPKAPAQWHLAPAEHDRVYVQAVIQINPATQASPSTPPPGPHAAP